MTINSLFERIVGGRADKMRFRAYQERMNQLPAPYRIAVRGLERYLLHRGAITRGDVVVRMLDDLGDLFEQAAAARTPLADIVGDDPTGFAEDFLSNYSAGESILQERSRLEEAIAHAQAEEGR